MTKRKEEIRELVMTVGFEQAIAALEDGEVLKSLGVYDEDQDIVEDLHAELSAAREWILDLNAEKKAQIKAQIYEWIHEDPEIDLQGKVYALEDGEALKAMEKELGLPDCDEVTEIICAVHAELSAELEN